ncbi:ABC transporter ATP-binding protein [Rhodovastum atsumiense]|uniref:ABC transporter ATP-binding protein n=1 Tax=Rhodovastum atsumiense TaxID=504468 RepID=A0A5M6ITS3_9PROT|nr:ABC transporter ATP-binding protein [Rhodovastum atsumiense]KAA5611723.1 ABC transporter ATP-binding protein [Rhodovastum atsumiense]CAH2604301.1 ABC transporter ATP-binding protein [Rhodovastum atsumiense]
MSTDLSVLRLSRWFDPLPPTVDDVSFDVAAGEIAVLLGPSGCGKTTTLRCVAGLEHPTSGRIRIGETICCDPAQGILVPARRRGVGMLFRSGALWPHMTLRQNVAYPLRHRGLPRAEIDRAVTEALALVGLRAQADRAVGPLSGEQMQRVALARSLVYRPRLLLLDEPLAGIDARLRPGLCDELRRIIRQVGVTALYVTRDQADAVALADRIGIMQAGRLLQYDTPDAIFHCPADLFVAGFTGASNLIDGRLLERTSSFGTVQISPGRLLLARMPGSLSEGQKVRVALRPDTVQLLPPAGGPNHFSVPVIARHYQGTRTLYVLDLFGTPIDAIDPGSRPRFPVGSSLPIALPPDACWVYAT